MAEPGRTMMVTPIRACQIRKNAQEPGTHRHGLCRHRICESVSENEERKRNLHTLVQEHLFPTIVEGLLRVLVLVALENGCKRGDVLHTSPKPFRDKKLPRLEKHFEKTPTSASRKRISDLRFPFLIEPCRELCISPMSETKRGR